MQCDNAEEYFETVESFGFGKNKSQPTKNWVDTLQAEAYETCTRGARRDFCGVRSAFPQKNRKLVKRFVDATKCMVVAQCCPYHTATIVLLS